MTHDDAGNYAGKHPEGTRVNERAAEALRPVCREGRISCADAFAVARELQIEPEEVGVTIDLLEYRIDRCQLGLFGYRPEKRIVRPAERVDEDMKEAIDEARDGGRITCAACWSIADCFGRPRMDVASACEALSLKVTACRLGSF